MPDTAAGPRPARGPALSWPEALVGLGVVALGLVVAWQTFAIPVSAIYARVGPRVFPIAVAGALVLLGAMLLWASRGKGWVDPEERAARPDWAALGWVVAGLVANVALIGPAGFTVASTVMFVCIARGFGSRAIARDLAIAVAIALGAYVGFAKGLGINIGAGPLERLLVGG